MKIGYAPIGASGRDGLGPFSRGLGGIGFNLEFARDVSDLDCIILWGGTDISPSLYKEERYWQSGPTQPSARDIFEWECIRLAVKADIPIIGICRGAQLLCAYAGGLLVQDVNHHMSGNHDITTSDGEIFNVTSCHHQMMVPWGVEHELLAWSTTHQATKYSPEGHKAYDSLRKREALEPEVVYFPKIKGYGIQCHPEWHPEKDPFNAWIMNSIKEKCFSKENV